MGLIISLVLGAVAGWAAGKLMHMEGSLLRNIIVGIVGGAVGSLLFSFIGIGSSNIIGHVLISIVGACICLWLVKKLWK